MKRLLFLILFVLLTIGAIAWLTGLESPFAGAKTHSVLHSRSEKSAAKSEVAKSTNASLLLGANVDYSKQNANKMQSAANSAVPSLVSIDVKKEGDWGNDPTIKKLNAKLAASGVVAGNGGCGFFIDRQGTILTNLSTLLGGFAWKVHASDGKNYDAELVGVDACTDLALIRIPKPGSQPVHWSGTQPNFAETLLLLGFDAKNGPRVIEVMTSSGILESTNGEEAVALNHFLIDYDLLDRCPGWLLSNLEGGVVGIVTNFEVSSDCGKMERVIISSESILPIIDNLQNTPLLHRVYAGMDSRQLTSSLASLAGVKVEKGLLVTKVKDDSPLMKAGLQAGDVVTALGDVAVNSKGQFYQLLSSMAIGAKVPLQIQRGSQQLTLQVVLQEHKSELQQAVQQWLDLVAKNRRALTTE